MDSAAMFERLQHLVVLPQLDGVVDGDEFLCSALVAFLQSAIWAASSWSVVKELCVSASFVLSTPLQRNPDESVLPGS